MTYRFNYAFITMTYSGDFDHLELLLYCTEKYKARHYVGVTNDAQIDTLKEKYPHAIFFFVAPSHFANGRYLDYAATRNGVWQYVQKFHSDDLPEWLIWLDSDEQLSVQNLVTFDRELSEVPDSCDLVYLWMSAPQNLHGHLQYNLLPRARVVRSKIEPCFTGKVHETLSNSNLQAGFLQSSDAYIGHLGYLVSEEEISQKNELRRKQTEAAIEEDGRLPLYLEQLARNYEFLYRHDVALDLFKEALSKLPKVKASGGMTKRITKRIEQLEKMLGGQNAIQTQRT